jgi:hypothetical protein
MPHYMNADVLLAICAGVLQLITAYLGLQATVRPLQPNETRRNVIYQSIFWMCGIAGVIAVGLSAVRSGHLTEKIDTVQKVLDAVNQDTIDLRQGSGFLRSQNQDLQDQLTSAGFKIRPDFRAVETFAVADLSPEKQVKVTVGTRNTGGEEATRVTAFFAIANGNSQNAIVDRLAREVNTQIERNKTTPVSEQIAKHSDVSLYVDGPILSDTQVRNIKSGIDSLYVAGAIYYHGSAQGLHMVRIYCGYTSGDRADFKLCDDAFGRHHFPLPIDFYKERQ